MTTHTHTYRIYSIDGSVPVTLGELDAGVGTDWSDESPMPVEQDNGELVGYVDPFTGEFTPMPN